MRTGDSTEMPRDDEPREIFARFVGEHGLSDDAAYQRLIAAHPAYALEFDRLRAELRTTKAIPHEPEARAHTPQVDIASRVRTLLDTLEKLAGPSGRFEDRGEVARGGMGKIHRFFDPLLRRSIVKKFVLPREDASSHQVALGRFLEEAQITAQLDHPGVIPVHDIGVDGSGGLWFSMRLVRGEDLRSIFDKARNEIDGWNLTRCIGVMLRICETMAYAHGKGVIHRDLKPTNVMVGRFGETYVMDWGLARVLSAPDSRDLRIRPDSPVTASEVKSDLRDHETPDSPLITMDGQVIGTPVYMSPEQASGDVENVGPLSDVYSVGAILYELLAGHMPYLRPGRQASKRSILQWVLNGPPERIADVAPQAPAPLIAICEKAMQRDRHARYASMFDLAEDLRAWLEGRVVAAHESGRVAHFVRWVDRNRGFAAALAALLVAISLSGYLLAYFRSRETEKERLDAKESSLRGAGAIAERLLREFDGPWPIEPATVPSLSRWIGEAESLIARTDEFTRELELRRRAGDSTASEGAITEGIVIESKRIQNLLDSLVDIEAHLAPATIEPGQRAMLTALKDGLSRELDFRMRSKHRMIWEADLHKVTFSNAEEQRRYDELARLVHVVERIAMPDEGLLTIQRNRLAACSQVARRSLVEHAADWERAIAEIADTSRSPRYNGLKLKPHLGLVPLGKDPRSGLFEFWHVASGEMPARGSNGEFAIGADTGLVLVLVPGGHYVIGATAHSGARRHDPAALADEFVFETDLEPFLLSKYEMTVGQWLRLTDTMPNQYHPLVSGAQIAPFSISNPVESVSSNSALRRLRDWGLTLPTQAQWEVAARAGTETAYWWGSSAEISNSIANIVDCTTERSVCPRDDGFPAHAPVDAFPTNPFGFHSILGNVAEWCSDWYLAEPEPQHSVGAEGKLEPAFLEYRAYRGGSFLDLPSAARASARGHAPPDVQLGQVGIRPLAMIQR